MSYASSRLRPLAAAALLAGAVPHVSFAQASRTPIAYPPTATVDSVDHYGSVAIPAPYRWLEDLNSPETAKWVEAQNAVTEAYLRTLPLRAPLRARITELWNYPRVSTPRWQGGQWYYSRNTGLQRQSVMYARRALNGPEHLVLDPNTFSADGSVALSGFVPSPDGRYLAYGKSEGGSDWSTYYVRNLQNGHETGDTIRWVKFSGLSWTHDGRGFFYGRYPAPAEGKALSSAVRDKKIYYHAIGTTQAEDRLMYERPEEPSLFISAGLDETGRYLFFTTNKGTSNRNELFVADYVNPKRPNLAAPIRPLYTGHTAAYDPLGVVNGTLYLMTDREAPLRRIVAVPLATPEPSHWKEVVPQGQSAIESADMVAGRIAVTTLEDVASVVRFYALDGTPQESLALPGLGTVGGVSGRFDRPEIFYSFTSPLTPNTIYRYDARTKRSLPFEPPKLTFVPSRYETTRVFYTSRDGTRVPMFITRRKGMALDGTNPTMLYAYGGFDISTNPTFRSDVPAWLELGGIWATANIRGGGEYGEAWHEAGMKEKKQNVFDDFIAAGEYLVKAKYTSPRKLGISGGSNGGLLVGAVMEQRPDLFAVALPAVGVMDMLRYQKFTGGAAWATEYGSADDSTAFPYLRAYSPLHNIRAGTCYPATLVTTADHDDRVVPSHSFKFTAALQKAQGCANPVLIRVETGGSHGYRPTDKRIAELADEWAFAAEQMGVGRDVRP
ncbi:MAG TPA: prolyl oligopeptidase family serine peptidase [Gemmatimonadaceae bacterium]|nr:prolyl oligopeptidase family serine peptidase [Gemmatimonadaceae bacterium]